VFRVSIDDKLKNRKLLSITLFARCYISSSKARAFDRDYTHVTTQTFE
jgi:hypothetical protein